MFFSKVLLFAISLGAISVLATPHALHHHALHHRAIAARVASNATDVTVKRQNSAKCRPPASSSASSSAPSSNIPTSSNTPSPSVPTPPIDEATPPPPPPATSSTPSSTSTPQQPPTTTSTADSAPTAAGTTGGPYKGQGTFFADGLGACGITNTPTQFIVAVSEIRFDSFPGANGNPNDNPICGKQVTISAFGQTATATITDRCVACADDDLDMTPSLFSVFALLGVGRIDITWNFVD